METHFKLKATPKRLRKQNKPGWLIMLFVLLFSMNSFAQQYKITGTVSDVDQMPIPGVNIILKGTTTGTVTDMNGKYTLNADSSNVVILFSAVGYTVQELSAAGRQVIDVVMEDELTALDEIVVIGYGTQKTSLVTGAISSIKSEDIENRSVSRAEQVLQGKTAGVYVIPQSGSPGAGMSVRIRGAGTNGNSNPLYIVDGIKTTDINNLDPNDIESMEVLKDGAASAIYGAEGGNGVVLVSTKNGKSGEGQVSYSLQYGIQSAGNLPKLMNAEEYGTYITEGGLLNIDPTEYKGKTGTDWMDKVYSNAPMQKHHLAFSGGTDKTQYLSSLSYYSQDGILGGSKANFERISARLNVDHQVKDWLKVGANVSYARTNRASLTEDDEFDGIMGNALMIDPLTPTHYENGKIPAHVQEYINDGKPVRYDSDGRVFGISKYIQGEAVNPYIREDIANGQESIDKLFGNLLMEIDLWKGLKFTSRPGLEYAHGNTHNYTATYYYSSERNNSTVGVNDNTTTFRKWQWDNFLTFDRKFGDNNLNLVLGMSAENSFERYLNSYSAPMPIENVLYTEHDYANSRKSDRVGGNEYELKMSSYFGRISYDYKNKYILQGTIRRDGAGTSDLHPDYNWGTFPSFSAGWLVSEEDFWVDNFINFAKVRGSWGRNGSVASLRHDLKNDGQFRYLAGISSQSLKYPYPNGYFPASEPIVLANDELTWETSQQLDFGLDLRMWQNRLSLTVDYFNKKTIDLLVRATPPLSVGNTAPFINAGDVENKGFEFNLGLRNRDNDFKYGINFNFTSLKNKVTKLNVPSPRIAGTDIGTGWTEATSFEVGKPIWYFRGYQTNGIDPATGDAIIVDVDGNGIINDEDKTKIGSPHPKFIYGANLNLEYKGFDFNLFIQGQSGNDVVMGWIRTDRQTANKPAYFYEDRWSPTNTTGTKPRSNADVKTWTSDQMVFDGSFTRIKQIQLGYTLPSTLLETIKMKNLRLYVSLDDYFTFTKYEGVDPEAGSIDYDSQGIDRGLYPIAKKIMFGLSVSF